MKRLLTMTALMASLGVAGIAMSSRAANTPTEGAATGKNAVHITRAGAKPATPGPTEYFTGKVLIDSQFQRDEPSRVTGAVVTFEPGARTNWHTHPLGQTLIVTEGTGLVQYWQGSKQSMKQGDVVWIPPGVKHWHGATPTERMSHIAIQERLDGVNVRWLEQVTAEQYGE